MTVPFRKRLTIATLLGLYAGWRSWFVGVTGHQPHDFKQLWFAARGLLAGVDPYTLVGPHRAYDWPAALFYPLPAVVAVVPLAPLSEPLAAGLFVAIGAGLFAWALMEHGYPPLLGFASAAMVWAIETAQWSPLLASALCLTPIAFFFVAKPTIGAALFLVRPSRASFAWAVGGALVLGGIAFLLQPDWLASWRTAIQGTSLHRGEGFPYVAPVMMPGGVLILLALTRWRRWEARLLLLLACVPQTLLLYEAVPLLLIPRTLRESEVMFVLSYVVFALFPRGAPIPVMVDATGRWIVLLLYLPCVVMVLRRPNEGSVPAWLERSLAYFPPALRGVPQTRTPHP